VEGARCGFGKESFLHWGLRPNKRLQLTPNSSFQSIRGIVWRRASCRRADGQRGWVQMNRNPLGGSTGRCSERKR
jgi:hypothetical protein